MLMRSLVVLLFVAVTAFAQEKSSPLPPAITAFVAKHCIDCHGPVKQKAGLALDKFNDEAGLLKARKTWNTVLDLVHEGEMPPAERKARPKVEEIDAFKKAVERIFVKADTQGPRDPGRITMRRLNRIEYNNTIRDLLGMDFNASEDLPPDDVGYGFDNIGDVLTISPFLMERYLAAAENIVRNAIHLTPAKPSEHYRQARYTEPSQQQDVKHRPLIDAKGAIFLTFKPTMAGEYKIKANVFATNAGPEPVKAVLWLDDKDIKTFEVKGTEKAPVWIEALAEVADGSHRMGVRLVNPDPGKDSPRTLNVRALVYSGPTDTRPIPQRKWLVASPGKSFEESTNDILSKFASTAYRRPATKVEVDRLAKLVAGVRAAGEKWEAGMQVAFQAVLSSPHFLFRVELDQRPVDKPGPIDEYHLASRLSYFLWNSLPDAELFDLASKKLLHKNVDAQVQRMLKDPRALSLVHNFAIQWLQLRNLKTISPDVNFFPDWDESLRSAMYRETELFLETMFLEDRPIHDLIDANYTFLNERLARHYGIVDNKGHAVGEKKTIPGSQLIKGPKFVKVDLRPGQRAGLLTQASLLTITSNPTRTSPVKRGRYILEQILGTPPPPPPPNVPELPDDQEGKKEGLKGTLRQRMELHRANAACANCHARMDPLGFAFENFNGIGKFRTQDGGQPIDASGKLPGGQTFQGPQELRPILKEKKDLVARCLAEKMLTYALGRGLEYYDKPAVDSIVSRLAKNDYRFSTLVTEIAHSHPFVNRRGKDQP